MLFPVVSIKHLKCSIDTSRAFGDCMDLSFLTFKCLNVTKSAVSYQEPLFKRKQRGTVQLNLQSESNVPELAFRQNGGSINPFSLKIEELDMGSFSSGVADGLQDLRSMRAESDARRSQRQRNDAQAEEGLAKARALNSDARNAVLNASLKTVVAQRNVWTSKASGCMVVIKQMMKLLEGMPVAEQERFRAKLADASLARMRELDTEHRDRDTFLDIEKNFKMLCDEHDLVVFPPLKPIDTLVMPPKPPEPQKPPEIVETSRPKYIFGVCQEFKFGNDVYASRQEASAGRDQALQKYAADHQAWKAQVDADEMTADREYRKKKIHYDQWIKKFGIAGEELSPI